MTGRDLDVIALLEAIYPGWSYQAINRAGLPRWWAHHRWPVTAAQHAAGARQFIGRTTPERLAAALGRQGEIFDRIPRRSL